MARLRASWRTSLPVVQQPRNPQSESIARSPYYLLLTPSALVFLLVVAESFFQAGQHFSGCLKHGFKLGLVHLADVLAQMIDDLLQAGLHFLSVMPRIAVGVAGHGAFLSRLGICSPAQVRRVATRTTPPYTWSPIS